MKIADESLKDNEAALHLFILILEIGRYGKLRIFLEGSGDTGDYKALTKNILHYYTLKRIESIYEEKNSNKNSTAFFGNRSQALGKKDISSHKCRSGCGDWVDNPKRMVRFIYLSFCNYYNIIDFLFYFTMYQAVVRG